MNSTPVISSLNCYNRMASWARLSIEARSRLKSVSTANQSPQNVLVLWMHGLQRFKAMKEFTAGHRLCCLYRQSHYVGLFQFAKDCLNQVPTTDCLRCGQR